MSLSSPSVSTPSPLTTLNRQTKQRRPSPGFQTSLRNPPLAIDDSDDEGEKAPQLSALARMLLDDFPESNAPPKPASANDDPSPRDRMDWSQSSIGEEYKTASVIRPPAESLTSMQASASASAIRWKRAGRGLLGGLAGPPRRGPKRDSDATEERISPSAVKEERAANSNPGSSGSSPTSGEEMELEQPLSSMSRRSRRSSPVSSAEQARINVYRGSSTPEEPGVSASGRSSPAEPYSRAAYSTSTSRAVSVAAAAAAAALPLGVPANDKENMQPPPTFRRPTSGGSFRRLGSAEEKPTSAPISPVYQIKPFVPLPAKDSPERKANALSTRSSNTPLRPAPPPPKMSMLETVTASAGASATASSQSSRRQRSVVHVNGKPYRRLDAIGKGGSSKVYKVMAENFKVLAMKKVNFSSQDGESAIRGYKGEIDLLRKLSGVDRVIRLYDWEINDEKQSLTMLMECGETDLAKVLTLRHGQEDSQMDVSFIRYYWREMLQCVQAVHDLNIIHSDLKPANFLLVQGRLKLIDFGIANAIQDDTVNVHRESQVGTLNYMSPEAIVDINATSGRPMASVGAPRLMKLGAPSDVWSLGCMLYQMTYGKGPFAHLTTMFQKINAIPDPEHPIEYPPLGIGGVPVPKSLINTISICLARNKDERPTIKQLLSDDDPFLNPDKVKEGVVDISMDMLRMLLESAVDHVTDRGAPSRDITAVWAKDVYGKLEKRMAETRRATSR